MINFNLSSFSNRICMFFFEYVMLNVSMMWCLWKCSTLQKEHFTCEVNKKMVDSLDVRLNSNKQTSEPYRKPNNEPVYTNIQSNYPPNIKADIPKVISKRLTNISCNKNTFNQNVDIYQAALQNSGFDEKITYNNQSEQENVNVLLFCITRLTLWMSKRI